MLFRNKQELKKVWESIEPLIISNLPNNIILTDTYYYIGLERESYLALEMNGKWVYFIFYPELFSIKIFSHTQISLEIVEYAVMIKNLLLNLVFPKQTKQAKTTKSE
jgi:hypothetical protein